MDNDSEFNTAVLTAGHANTKSKFAAQRGKAHYVSLVIDEHLIENAIIESASV